ncbi:MAG: YraN family protein [Phycisphaeraceae bacterium]|nr:YraN family protein [Phycisphaeraceae bacterium]
MTGAIGRLRALVARPARAGSHNRLGARGERAAARFLKRRGYRVLARNARTVAGEADLVCQGPQAQRVIVEVKTRVRDPENPVPPEVNVTSRKRATLASIARHLARANRWDPATLRIDVVTVEYVPGRRAPEIRHILDAVSL